MKLCNALLHVLLVLKGDKAKSSRAICDPVQHNPCIHRTLGIFGEGCNTTPCYVEKGPWVCYFDNKQQELCINRGAYCLQAPDQ